MGRAHPSIRPMQESDLEAVSALDRSRFGADRSFFLARRLALYPEVCRVHLDGDRVDGYILGRSREKWTSLGPWLATAGPEAALALLEGVAPEHGLLDVAVGVLDVNAAAVPILRGLGMQEREDPPWRMALGSGPLLGMSADLYAIGSPAKG